MRATKASFSVSLLLSLGALSLGCLGSWGCEAAKSEGAGTLAASPVASNAQALAPGLAAPEQGGQPAAPKAASETQPGAAREPSAAAVASALTGTQPVSVSNPASPATGAAGTPSGPVAGTPATGEGFAAYIEAQGSYAVGKAASVKVVLKATPPFHCNDKYPYKFTPAPGAGLTFKDAVARGMNIAPGEATMDVGFTPSQAGKLTFSGELSFSVCTEDRCLVEKQLLSVAINAKDAT